MSIPQSLADCAVSVLAEVRAIGGGIDDDHPMRHVAHSMKRIAEQIISDAMRQATDIAYQAKQLVKDYDEAACKARKWTLIAPDGRVWQNESPMLISAALLAELGGYMEPLGGDFARILNENRWALYGDTEATPNDKGNGPSA